MRILITILALIPVFAMAQATSSTLTVTPAANQRVYTTDSVQIFARAAGTSNILTMKWAKGNVTAKDTTIWRSGPVADSYFWLYKLPAGVYPFSVTATDANGATQIARDTLTVVAAPAPRTVKSASFSLVNGVLTLTGIVYSDDATQ